MIRLAKLYPYEFSHVELRVIDKSAWDFYHRSSLWWSIFEVNGITDLSKMLVKIRKHIMYPVIDLLVRLTLISPVTTTTVGNLSLLWILWRMICTIVWKMSGWSVTYLIMRTIKKILNIFKIWKLVEDNYKLLYIFIFFRYSMYFKTIWSIFSLVKIYLLFFSPIRNLNILKKKNLKIVSDFFII